MAGEEQAAAAFVAKLREDLEARAGDAEPQRRESMTDKTAMTVHSDKDGTTVDVEGKAPTKGELLAVLGRIDGTLRTSVQDPDDVSCELDIKKDGTVSFKFRAYKRRED